MVWFVYRYGTSSKMDGFEEYFRFPLHHLHFSMLGDIFVTQSRPPLAILLCCLFIFLRRVEKAHRKILINVKKKTSVYVVNYLLKYPGYIF